MAVRYSFSMIGKDSRILLWPIRIRLWPIMDLKRHTVLCSYKFEAQLNATISGAYGSIRDTLQHIVTSEQSYFSRNSTGQRNDRPEDAPPLTLAEMVESARTTGSGLIEWVPKVQAGDTVQLDWEGTPRDMPKTIILTQVITTPQNTAPRS